MRDNGRQLHSSADLAAEVARLREVFFKCARAGMSTSITLPRGGTDRRQVAISLDRVIGNTHAAHWLIDKPPRSIDQQMIEDGEAWARMVNGNLEPLELRAYSKVWNNSQRRNDGGSAK